MPKQQLMTIGLLIRRFFSGLLKVNEVMKKHFIPFASTFSVGKQWHLQHEAGSNHISLKSYQNCCQEAHMLLVQWSWRAEAVRR
jgi:hypothetical protein